MKLNYLSYCNKYQFRVNDYTSLNINSVCFGDLFKKLERVNTNSGTLRIWFASDDKLNKKGWSNYCLLTEKELKFYFSWVKYVTGLDFSYKKLDKIEIESTECNGYVVNLKFKNKSAYLIKLFATLIRNVYEKPFNIQLKTAMLLNEYSGFKNLDFTSRLMISVASITDDDNRDVHASYYPYHSQKLIKKQKLKDRVSKRRLQDNVSGTFPDYDKKYFKKIVIENNNDIFLSLENNSISEQLLEKLKQNYKIIKNINE